MGKAGVRSWERLNGYRGERRRPGVGAMTRVVQQLDVDAAYVLFGHLHRAGTWRVAGGTTLLNTGSWIAADTSSPPGTCTFIRTKGSPETRQLL